VIVRRVGWMDLRIVSGVPGIRTNHYIYQSKPQPMEKALQALLKFRNERDWEQFHNPKDLALAINIEAGELLELFLWKDAEEAKKERVKEELADVFSFALLLAEKYDFDVEEIIMEKIKSNAEKYPVDKAKGTAKKYNEL
jgi:NTP pyrophosphatase (non-canonical NTP hydrolase)